MCANRNILYVCVFVYCVCRLNMDFYCLQKEAIESYVHCFNVFFEMVSPTVQFSS